MQFYLDTGDTAIGKNNKNNQLSLQQSCFYVENNRCLTEFSRNHKF